MNGTTSSSTHNSQDQKVGGFGYGLALSITVFLFIIIVTYCSYVSTRSRSRTRLPSRNYFITTFTTTTTTTGNDGIAPKQRGIDENTLKQYPKLLYSDLKKQHHGPNVSECSICLADYRDSDMIRMLPECGHIFHLICIDPWLEKHTTCPICRTTPDFTPLATPLAEVVPLANLSV